MKERKIFETLWGYQQVIHHFDDVDFIHNLLRYESHLAKCQASLGMIPQEANEAIKVAIGKVKIDDDLIERLNESTSENGIPTIGLVKTVKDQLEDHFHSSLHFGVTSQDLIDSAHMMALKRFNQDFQMLLKATLKKHISAWMVDAEMVCVSRTRQQQALTVTFGYKLYNWFVPLIDSLQELSKLKFPVQLGGPVGDLRAFGKEGKRLTKALSESLGLDDFGSVWHQNRRPVIDILNAYEIILLQLRKILQDWIFLANSEIAEIMLKTKGKSSSMAHKNNPVQLEQCKVLIQIGLDHIQIHKSHSVFTSERDGVSWSLEWYYLSALDISLQNAANAFTKTLDLLVWDFGKMKSIAQMVDSNLYDTGSLEFLLVELKEKLAGFA